MLRTADYRGVLAVLETVEPARSLSAFRKGTLAALAEHLGYDVSAFLIAGAGRRGVEAVTQGVPQRRLDRHLARWSARGSRPSGASRSLLEPGRPIDLDEVRAALGTAPARPVGEYLRSEQLHGLLAVALNTVGPVRAALILLAPRKNAFGSADRERLAVLAPHLGNLLGHLLPEVSPAGPASRLTAREAETVDLVEKHVSAALTKLGVSSRTQLTLAWLDDETSHRTVATPPGVRRLQRSRTEPMASATRST
jgi:hypothetical protein